MEAFTSVRARWLKIASYFKLIARSMKNRKIEAQRKREVKVQNVFVKLDLIHTWYRTIIVFVMSTNSSLAAIKTPCPRAAEVIYDFPVAPSRGISRPAHR